MRNRFISTYFVLALGMVLLNSSCSEKVQNARQLEQLPPIWPDYINVTIPVNIAPLNFCLSDSDASRVDVIVKASNGEMLHHQTSTSTCFNEKEWHQLLTQATGDSLSIHVSAKYSDGWRSYKPFNLYVSTDSIDYGITYRLIEPGYKVWSKMGIYERCLSNFEEHPLLENTQFQGCVNCHSTSRSHPNDMTLHIRGPHGATLLQLNGKLQAYNTATSLTAGNCVYPYWHPEGRYLAYSTNTTRQSFHTANDKRIEVFDEASDIQVYDTQTNELIVCPLLKRDSVMETFPVFSSDGKKIFFCEAKQPHSENIDLQQIHYNLCSIDFDASTGSFGNTIDTLIFAEAEEKSISFPRPSFDGRFLCFTLADYGQFSIWHPEADLYLLDLQADSLCVLSTKASAISRMDAANSADTESFHNWSSNSRWMLFSSRRDDGWFTRIYFTHVDADGHSSKPFILPQQSPKSYYDELFMSYNVPEFIVCPSKLDSYHAAELINAKERVNFSIK